MRSKLERVPAILASATPAIETRQMAEIGVYAEVKLPDRYGVAEMPDIAAIDLLADPPPRGRWLAPTLFREIETNLARGEQTLLFLRSEERRVGNENFSTFRLQCSPDH